MADTFTANLFRTDTGGRRVFCPLGRRVYAVSPDDERRIKRAVRWFDAATLLLVVVVTMAVMPNWPWLAVLVPLLVVAELLLRAFVAGTLVPLGSCNRTTDPADADPPLGGDDRERRLGALVVGCGVLRIVHGDTRCAAVEVAATLSAA